MATQCDIGATIHVVFPPSGGVQLLAVEDGIAILVLSNVSVPALMAEMRQKKDEFLASVGMITFSAAFRRLARLS